ncbi:DUF1501 domain-containing protein [Paraurantiacibacter namhicola]|uniref:DUF1501 domain-containing protein n=1 Tax=Paraurantiacibacter namhicola TaxID=645517 RepID=A0A1C7DA29_9SPHN|nr:DUF1501 domain-containing protein [Paraurantiacibacter namhicola]ANU08308.1 hypothetical protein A6F65_02021 [Paraurantiacibacter namhicola]
MIDRRTLLHSGLWLGSAAAFAPRVALAAEHTEKRFLFVLQRGAADGLDLLAPLGDPELSGLRGPWMGDLEQRQALDGFFALHPMLGTIGAMYAAGEAAFVHAAASSYRERSHFDAQNLIESGGAKPYVQRDGWMNRLVGLMTPGSVRALALAPSIPLALQGPQPTSSYAPTRLRAASENYSERVGAMYAADPLLSRLWDQALQTRAMAGDTQMRNLRDAEKAGALAASLMSGADGARIMMVESDGWDSHQGQPNQIGGAVGRLDSFLSGYRAGMADSWTDTLVIVATEFGRTARINGTNGTDHGTASAAMLLGGAVRGGRVVADWPGLASSSLLEGRDLMPTASLEAVIAGSAAEHFALDPQRAMATLFPGRQAAPMAGLVRG